MRRLALAYALKKKKVQLLLLTLPMVALVFVFHYLPLFGWLYAFVDYYPGMALSDMKFVGLKNFAYIFSPMFEFPVVIRNTLVMSGLCILCKPVPIIFAILLGQIRSKRYSRLVQTVSAIPNFISWVLVYAIFFAFFSSEDSVFNRVMLALNLWDKPRNLLGDASIAWPMQLMISMWKFTGYEAIIYISAMTGIDPELYCAADVDGAGRFQQILHVTVPGLMPTFLVLLLLSIANLLSNGFEQYYIFQNPLTIDRLEVLDTYIYRMGILSSQYSFGTAIGMFKSVLSILLLVFANGLSKLIRGESIL